MWACDVEQLAEQGPLERVAEFEGYALYDERQLTSPPRRCARRSNRS
ncbi:hypothetical protein [Streptomyces deserti]